MSDENNDDDHMAKMAKYNKYLESIEGNLLGASTTLGNLMGLIKDDYDGEMAKYTKAAAVATPVPKKTRIEILDLSDDTKCTWKDYFDPADICKLDFDGKSKADQFTRRMQQTYRQEMNLVVSYDPTNHGNQQTYELSPVRGIVTTNMISARNAKRTRYIGMISFLANYKEEIGDIVPMTNKDFKFVVERHNIATLKEWREDLFSHWTPGR